MYLHTVWLDNVSNAQFVQWIYAACLILDREGVDPKRVHIENNSLQNPHYEQVIVPLIQEHFRKTKYRIPIRPDNRKKPSKFERIEGTRSEEHTSELQSRGHLVCRLL